MIKFKQPNGFQLAFIAICLLLAYACKKAPVNNQVFVKNYLNSKWLVKATIIIEKKNNDTLRKDTIKLANDTAIFTSDLKYWRKGVLSSFNVDEKALHIKIESIPDTNWYIDYMRKTEFSLTFIRKDTSNTDIRTYSTQRIFTKLSLY